MPANRPYVEPQSYTESVSTIGCIQQGERVTVGDAHHSSCKSSANLALYALHTSRWITQRLNMVFDPIYYLMAVMSFKDPVALERRLVIFEKSRMNWDEYFIAW